MMCFRDKTFCPFYEDCSGHPLCGRGLTPAILYDASIWWGGDDAPISQFADKPDCFADNHGCPVGFIRPKLKE